jgi:SAM-dependent methyltransferase
MSPAGTRDFEKTSVELGRDRRHDVRRELLIEFMADAPFQPATNFWRAIELPELASVMPGRGRGLDVGCGDGVLTRILRDLVQAHWTLVGVDPDPAETALAEKSGIYAKVYQTGADSVPEPENSFDFAFANSVLEHIPDLPPCLAETARCLKPGGLFLATVPSPGLHRLMRGPGVLRRQSRDDYLEETDRRLAHFRYPTVEGWTQLLGDAGFELMQVRGYLAGKQVRRWETWTNWTGGLLYRLKGAKDRPIEIQRTLGLRRGLPRGLRWLSLPLAWALAIGVIDEDSSNPYDNGCLLIVARKRT